ncbi:MAG TPA: M23 family metallopeptidase [bacterium]|nr:M23 family metallopeptidase [bacterium]
MKKTKIFLVFVFLLMMPVLSLNNANATTLYRLPLASNPGYNAWFDHNASVGSELRYDCVTNFSYDNHHGTDFAASFGTSIYSGAAGSLYYRVDNCPDGSQPSCGSYYGNHVRLWHADGRVTIYAHMRQWTPIWYQSVLCGVYIGQSGNSGQSSGPHLHFELWQNTGIGTRLDFFGGNCNSPSYWVNQNGGWPTTQCQ